LTQEFLRDKVEEEVVVLLEHCQKMTCPWQTMMSENNSELWNLFPELLNCFYFFILYFFIIHRFCVKLFSGQDEGGLMLQQLSHLTD